MGHKLLEQYVFESSKLKKKVKGWIQPEDVKTKTNNIRKLRKFEDFEDLKIRKLKI